MSSKPQINSDGSGPSRAENPGAEFASKPAATSARSKRIELWKERIYKARNEKNGIQRYLARKLIFNLFQSLGFHVTGDHFYEIIPNTREVAAKYVDQPRALKGIDFQFSKCESRVLKLINDYGAEYSDACGRFGFVDGNIYFRGLDALMLYLVLRDLKPAKLVEVGQGFSTRIALCALEKNAAETGQKIEFISIDPYARSVPANLPPNVNFRCIRQPLQSVDLDPVLKDCRFLFIDSSHVYKFGSDVEYEFDRLYPNLRPQTVVHIHDVFSPYNYPQSWMVERKWFWNEQYFLEAFLSFNNQFEVYLPMHLLFRQSTAFENAVKKLKLKPDFIYLAQSFYLLRT